MLNLYLQITGTAFNSADFLYALCQRNNSKQMLFIIPSIR